MAKYTGFVSDVIRRSEKLIKIGQRENLDATALLMLMMSGFAIPYERLSNWEEHDPGLRNANLNRIKRLADRVKGGLPHSEFQDVNLLEWKYYEIKDDGLKPKHFRETVLPNIAHKLPSLKYDKTLKDIMWCMRNALAHGGIHPMSPHQIASYNGQNAVTPWNGQSDEINRVFFVGRMSSGQDVGINVVDVPLSQVRAFWRAWKKLLIGDLGDDGLAILDSAA